MSELRYLLLVVFCIDAFLLMGQYGAQQLNPSGTHFMNYQGSISSTYDKGNYTLNGDVGAQLPTGSSSISPTTGNIFTDAFTTLKSWILSIPGVNFVIAAANAIPNWLSALGLDPVFAYFISAIWHAYAIWLLVEFFVGR